MGRESTIGVTLEEKERKVDIGGDIESIGDDDESLPRSSSSKRNTNDDDDDDDDRDKDMDEGVASGGRDEDMPELEDVPIGQDVAHSISSGHQGSISNLIGCHSH